MDNIEINYDKLKFLSAEELFYIYTDDEGYDHYVPFSEAVKYKLGIIKNKLLNKIHSLFN